ncbi:57a8b159-a03f-41bf-85e8-e000fc477235 [Sclerotinia trifoliorum]|uniref:Mediator of RNA polymerase II transcription subunit 16 n=1 Tax=Sclerotinia trifoliorum TaxID=28548 RepID=A0A8H2VXG4_9HELO|nr:57a8b159-a03f-41bf-85e8-e000fc477235 [Sclerotinia trifoliorum]
MPLMMEDVENMDVDMDDLFGDGAGLSLPSRPPPSKELHQRIDELRGSGCCQGIAWSKWGSIASITPNGNGLELRNLRCHPTDGTWGLSKPTLIPQLTNNLDGGPLKHLSWSPTGSELAVIDSAGRVTILQIFSSLNKPGIIRPCSPEPADDLHAVVGCFWLNLGPFQNRPAGRLQHGPAIKEASGFRYDVSQAPILGPNHPIPSKSAFLYVTSNGSLRLLWQQGNNKWFESHTELESIVSSDDLITHAAICAERTPSLLIALATGSKQLRIIRAGIDWGMPQTQEKVNQMTLSLNASLRIKPLTVTSWMHDVPGDTLNPSHLESSMVQLSHLKFLSPCGDSKNHMTPPIVVAVRSYLPGSTSHYNQEVYSTVDRWEFRERNQQPVHSAFEHLSSRKGADGPQSAKPVYTAQLKKLESFTINKVVVAMQTIYLGKIVCFAYSDSSVDYRDRISMNETFNDGDLDRVSHLSQIGFSYAEDEPCLQVVLSPSTCSLAQITNDGKVKWKQLDYHLGEIGPSMEDPRYAATIAALSISCSTSVMMAINYDDIIATAHNFAKTKDNLAYDWLNELAKILKITVDYSEEAHYDVLIRNTTIQLCLSIQNSLGFRGDFNPRKFAGKFSWLVLQLRNIVVLVTMAANMKVPGPTHDKTSTPLDDPEVISALAGSVRWVLDLMAWIIDTLLDLPSSLPGELSLTDPAKLSLPDLLAHLHTQNNVTLHLLLSSPTRGFLTAICRRLQHLDYVARKAIATNTNAQNQPGGPGQQSISPALRSSYVQIAQLTSNCIVRIKTFETLLSSLTLSVKSAYANHKPPLSGNNSTGPSRNGLEIKMLFGGEIPTAFKPVIIDLFKGVQDNKKGDEPDTATDNAGTGHLSGVRLEIEPSDLWFADFTMLEVEEEEECVARRKNAGLTMDCFRKTWLSNPPPSSSKSSSSKKSLENGSSSAAVISGDNLLVPIPGFSAFGLGPPGAAVNGNGNGNGNTNSTTTMPKRWRRCARCAAVMEDVLSQRPTLQWLVMQQRRCFCSGYWDTLQSGEMAA